MIQAQDNPTNRSRARIVRALLHGTKRRDWNHGDMAQSSRPHRRRVGLTRTLNSRQAAAVQTWINQTPNTAVWSENMTAATVFDKPEQVTYWTTTHHGALSLRSVLVAPGLAMGRVDVTLKNPDQLKLSVVCTPLDATNCLAIDEERLASLGELLMEAISDRDSAFAPVDCPSRGIVLDEQVKVDIDEAFRLACPVAELEWLDQWQFDLVSSECGTNEDHCIFVESWSAPAMHNVLDETTWYTATYDKVRHHFFAVLVTGDHLLSHWDVTMDKTANGTVRVKWKHTYYGLDDRGRALVSDPSLEGRMNAAFPFIGESFRSYAEDGQVTRLSIRQKFRIARSFLLTHIRRGQRFDRPLPPKS